MSFPESKNRQGKILIAEDDNINQQLMAFHLKQWRNNLVFANNGKEALQIFREFDNQISLVLMDLRMPLMDGVEATQKILEINPGAKVIALSAFAQEENRSKTGNVGFVEYLTKPIRKEDLVNIIDKYLD